jgi:hypothetical protein
MSQASPVHATQLRRLFASSALDEALLQISDMRLRYDLADATRYPGDDELYTPRGSNGASFRNGYSLESYYKEMYEANVKKNVAVAEGGVAVAGGPGEARLL